MGWVHDADDGNVFLCVRLRGKKTEHPNINARRRNLFRGIYRTYDLVRETIKWAPKCSTNRTQIFQTLGFIVRSTECAKKTCRYRDASHESLDIQQ